jgi:general stress protein YciG
MPLKRSKPSLARCKATTSSGTRCKAKPHKDGLCFFHSDPKKAAELGRKGGRRNRHSYETPLQHVTAPESAGDVKRMLAETMAEVRAGKMDPKLGSTLGYLGTALLRAFEVADLEQRLERLEELEEKNELEEQAEQT